MKLTTGVLMTLLAASAATAQTPAAAPASSPQADQTAIPLRNLVLDALKYNLTISSVRSTTRSTETGIQSARSAFDPLLSVTPSYSESDMQVLAQPGQTISGTQTNSQLGAGVSGTLPFSTGYSVTLDSARAEQSNADLLAPPTQTPSVNTTFSVGLSQPLLRGFGSIASAPVDLASYTSKSANSRFERTVDQTVADVESAYWNLGLAEAIERLSRDSYDRAVVLRDRNDKMLSLNLISDVDTIVSRRGVQQRLTSLTDAIRQRKDAVERLVFLVYGREAAARLSPDPTLPTEEPPANYRSLPPLKEMEAQALDRRQDIAAARFDLNQIEVSKRIAHNSLLPDARLSASYSALTVGTDSFRLYSTSRPGDVEQWDWRVGLNFSFPLFNRSARAAYAKARYDMDAQADNVASAEVQVRTEVRAAARAIQTNLERLEQARLSFDLSKQQYAAGEKQLQLGLIDSFRLLQMEDEVSANEQVYEQTRYDLAVAIASYELATGVIGQKYGVGPEAARR